jgi:hypothetical protein
VGPLREPDAANPPLPLLPSPLGLPVLRLVPFDCMLSPIPGRSDGNWFVRTFPSSSAFSESEAGRPLHYAFRGLLSVYSGYGLHARRVANATFYTEGFSSFVASATASIATGWNEPVPGRDFFPAEDQRLFTGALRFARYQMGLR